jgi:hypothetical protein
VRGHFSGWLGLLFGSFHISILGDLLYSGVRLVYSSMTVFRLRMSSQHTFTMFKSFTIDVTIYLSVASC